MMNSYVYPSRIVPAEEGGWLIRFRDFPEGISQAEANEDVIDIAEGCLQACIEGRLEYGMAIPEASEPKSGEVLVTVPIETATKAALFQTVAASGTSRVALAKAVDLDEKQIRRMLDPRHSSKLPRIEQVLRALGKQLRISLVDVVKPPRASGQQGKPEARQTRADYRAKHSRRVAMKRVHILKPSKVASAKAIDPDNPPWREKMLGPRVSRRVRGSQKTPTKVSTTVRAMKRKPSGQ